MRRHDQPDENQSGRARRRNRHAGPDAQRCASTSCGSKPAKGGSKEPEPQERRLAWQGERSLRARPRAPEPGSGTPRQGTRRCMTRQGQASGAERRGPVGRIHPERATAPGCPGRRPQDGSADRACDISLKRADVKTSDVIREKVPRSPTTGPRRIDPL
jgi:hypothetical protein